MRILIDENKCSGYCCCIMTAPELFEFDDARNIARVIDPEPAEELRGQAEAATRSCPVRAITIIDP